MYVNEVLETCLCLEIMLKLFALCLEVIVFDTLHVTSKTCGTLFPLSLSLYMKLLYLCLLELLAVGKRLKTTPIAGAFGVH